MPRPVYEIAGWHQTGGELELPDNIANKLSRCVWDDYDAILRACADGWNRFIADPERVRSIGTREWTTVSF
jgi:hypothetical protein